MGRKYITKAREAILDYLREIQGEHVTVKDVYDHFHGSSEKIGKTTIYRQLDEFVKEGLVKRCILDGNEGTCFEYVGKSEELSEDVYHVKCESCGRLMHLQCKEVSELWNHLLDEHSFQMDPYKTVIYGRCGSCMAREKDG